MALQKQMINLPLATGLDTQSDPKLTKGLTKLVNAYVERNGEIRRRPGELSLSKATSFRAGQLVRADAVYPGPHEETVLFGRDAAKTLAGTDARTIGRATDSVFVLSKSGGEWRHVLNHRLVKHSIKRISPTSDVEDISGADPLVSATVVEGAGYRMYVYARTSRNVFVTIVDTVTGATVHSDREISDSVSYADFRAIKIWDTTATPQRYKFLVLVRADTGGLARAIDKWTWDPGDPETFSGSLTTIVTSVDDDTTNDDIWDAKEISHDGTAETKRQYAVVFCNTSDDLSVHIFNGVANTAAVIASDALTLTGQSLSFVDTVDASGVHHLKIAYFQSPAGTKTLYVSTFNLSGGTFDAAQSVEATPSIVGEHISIMRTPAFDDANSLALLIAYGDNGNAQTAKTRFVATEYSGAIIGGGTTVRNARLVSYLFGHDDKAYCIVEYGISTVFSGSGAFQRAFFLLQINQADSTTAVAPQAYICSKLLSGVAATRSYETTSSITFAPVLTRVEKLETNKFIAALAKEDRLLATSDSTREVLVSYVEATLDFDPFPARSIEHGECTLIGGGQIVQFDSNRAAEVGFHLYPDEIISATQGVGGSMVDGTYSYIALYEWVDAAGQLHRSAPSPAFSEVVATGGGTASEVVVVPTLQFTDREVRLGDVSVVLYRTEASGTLYFRVTSAANVSSADSVSLTDTLSDANLILNEALYTTGGVIENIGPPAGFSVAATENRALVLSDDDPWAVWYSKNKSERVGTEFSDLFTQRVDSEGPNTAVAVLDGAIVLFKRKAIYIFSGEGPNNLGAGQFSAAQKISSDLGCRNYASVVSTDLGIFFESDRGIYLLTRSHTVQYIGAPLEGLGDIVVRSACVVGRLSQVRFVRAYTNQMLVFDTLRGLWSIWEYNTILRHGNELVGNGFYLCGSGGRVFKETDTRDGGLLALDTGWISVETLIGYQRLYWVYLLGQLGKKIKLAVNVSYDYDDEVKQTVTLDGTNNLWRIKPKIQKCTAFKIGLAEQNGSKGELRLTSLGLVIGAKKGFRQLKGSK